MTREEALKAADAAYDAALVAINAAETAYVDAYAAAYDDSNSISFLIMISKTKKSIIAAYAAHRAELARITKE